MREGGGRQDKREDKKKEKEEEKGKKENKKNRGKYRRRKKEEARRRRTTTKMFTQTIRHTHTLESRTAPALDDAVRIHESALVCRVAQPAAVTPRLP